MRVLISQRVDIHPARGERRDALDQAWGPTFDAMLDSPAVVVPIPNRPERVTQTIEATVPQLIVLSGGNDLGEAPERDATEAALLMQAAARRIPVLAVCRGMQMVQHALGGTLERIDGHVAQPHALQPCAEGVGPELWTNSFHTWAIRRDALAEALRPLYEHADGSIEAARHRKLPWLAVMWHPERATPGDGGATDWVRRWLKEQLR